MKRILASLIVVMLCVSVAFAGGFTLRDDFNTTRAGAINGTATQANTTIVTTDGSATFNVNQNGVLTNNVGKYIVVTDQAGKTAKGWISAALTGASFQGVTIVNTQGGATQNWVSVDAGFSIGASGSWFTIAPTAADIISGTSAEPTGGARYVYDTYGSTELVLNNKFDTLTSGTPDDGTSDDFGTWVETSSLGTSKIEATATTTHSSGYAVKISTGDTTVSERQTLTTNVGQPYILSFWSYGDGSTYPRYAIYNGAGFIVNPTNVSSNAASWALTSVPFTATTTTTTIYLYMPTGAGGVAIYDDVSVLPTSGLVSISGGNLVFAGGLSTAVLGNPGLWEASVARTAGRNLIAHFNFGVNNKQAEFGWDNNQGSAPVERFEFGSDGNVWCGPAGGANVGTYSTSTDNYANQITRATGYFSLFKPTTGSWKLYWISSAGTHDPAYPTISNYTSAFTSSYLRIPTTLWLPTPIASDSFGQVFGTTDGWGHAEGQMLTNGSFETVTGTADDGTSDDFGTWVDTAGDGKVELTATTHGGTAAVKFTAGASLNAKQEQTVTVTPSTNYTLSFWTRGDGAGHDGRYSVENVTLGGYVVSSASTGITGTDYILVSVPVAIPAATTSIKVATRCPGTNGGIAYFDDVRLIPSDGLGSGGSGLTWASSGNTWSMTGGVAKNTPTPGAALSFNNEFTTNTTDWTGSNATISRVDSTTDPGTVSGGADAYVLKVVDAGSSAAGIHSGVAITSGTWYSATGKVFSTSANTEVNKGYYKIGSTSGGGEYVSATTTTVEDVWQTRVGTFRGTGTTAYPGVGSTSTTNGDAFYGDAINIYPLALSELITTVPASTANVLASVQIAASPAGTQAGVVTNVDDAANPTKMILSYTDGTNCGAARLTDGTWTQIVNMTACTFVANAEIRAITDDTSYRLYYNNAQVGSTATLATAVTATRHGMFSTYSGNQLDNFTLYARGTSGEYSTLNNLLGGGGSSSKSGLLQLRKAD